MKHIYSDEREKFAEAEIVPAAESVGLKITDDPIARLQGFGGCFNELGYRALAALREEDRAAVFDELFTACNFNFCRLPVGANDFSESWYSYDETEGDYALKDFSIERDRKNILPYVKEALKRRKDMILFASPWSPPVWLKTNGKYNGGRLKPDDRSLNTYAEYLSRYLTEYEKEGVSVRYLFPQNEVVADQVFPSCLFTGAELKRFAEVLCDTLSRNNPKTRVWLGTINSHSFEEYAFLFFEDASMRTKIGGVGYQWLGKEALQRTRLSFPDIPVVQTESECGDGRNTYAYAEYVFSLMQHYLSNGAEAYVYWNMALGSDPHSTWGWAQNSLITVDEKAGTWRKNPEFYVMKHFSAFLSRGDAVVRTEGPWSGNSVSFRRQSGQAVAVIHNPLDEARRIGIECGGKKFSVLLRPHSLNTVLAD